MNVAFDPKLIDHLELREKALKERDARALYQMAQIYASMKGKKNEKKAYELYKSSATHGYAKARFMMGLCNEKGIGVKQSLPMAITWYIRAEISAVSDIADRSDTADEMDRERLHIFREEPGFATELDDAAYARPDVLESVTIEEIAFAAEQGDPYAQDWDTITVWEPMVWKKILRQPSIGIGNLPSKVVRLVYTIWHSFISERNDTMKL